MLDFVNLQPAFNPYCQTEIIYINDVEHSRKTCCFAYSYRILYNFLCDIILCLI